MFSCSSSFIALTGSAAWWTQQAMTGFLGACGNAVTAECLCRGERLPVSAYKATMWAEQRPRMYGCGSAFVIMSSFACVPCVGLERVYKLSCCARSGGQQLPGARAKVTMAGSVLEVAVPRAPAAVRRQRWHGLLRACLERDHRWCAAPLSTRLVGRRGLKLKLCCAPCLFKYLLMCSISRRCAMWCLRSNAVLLTTSA